MTKFLPTVGLWLMYSGVAFFIALDAMDGNYHRAAFEMIVTGFLTVLIWRPL